MIDLKAKIYVAGHKGLVGSAILRKLNKRGYKKIITENKSKLDLTNQSKVVKFFSNKVEKEDQARYLSGTCLNIFDNVNWIFMGILFLF